jgi:stearoyl-CoA desaturase (delta-9 desaturase)
MSAALKLKQTAEQAEGRAAVAPRWNISHTTLVVGVHSLSLLGLWFWPRAIDVALLLGLYLVTTFGIGIGYHRLLTHRGFVCSTWLRRLLTWMGCAALQGGPTWWVSVHRRHHRATDRDGDPHTPLEGFFHSHVGWIMQQDELDADEQRQLVPDVAGDDPWLRIMDRELLYIMPWALTGVICFAVAGWRGVLWGTIIRTLALWHFTWSVNSVCHTWGSRPNPTRDGSRNVWWVGLLTLGEGWHNNHHARPASALHGWRWYEIDVSGYVIRLMARVGLVRQVVRPPSVVAAP